MRVPVIVILLLGVTGVTSATPAPVDDGADVAAFVVAGAVADAPPSDPTSTPGPVAVLAAPVTPRAPSEATRLVASPAGRARHAADVLAHAPKTSPPLPI